MDPVRIELITQYLTSLDIPDDASKSDQRYLKTKGHIFTMYKGKLHLLNLTSSHCLKKVLNKEESVEAIIQYHHHPLGGHFGFNNTIYKIAEKYYWDNMQKDIKNYIKQCPNCQSQGSKLINEQLHPIKVSQKPFEKVFMDVKHVITSRKGCRYVIVAICSLTKYVELRAIRFQTSAEISLFIYENCGI